MKSVIALEDLIKENEERIKLQNRQLADHESGENRLSGLMKASVETNLEKTIIVIEKYKAMLADLMAQDQAEVEEKIRLEEAVRREKYFKNQNIRIKKAHERSNDRKIEAMMILDELPSGVEFDDDELFDVATRTIELNIRNHEELKNKLTSIRTNFQNLIKNDNKKNIKDLAMLNYQIPILALQFSMLFTNILENLERDKEQYLAKLLARNPKDPKDKDFVVRDEASFDFKGFPKFQDWWVKELWSSHQAYFALYKWKSIINNLCKTIEQKKAWSIIFSNWLFIKKMICTKGELGFEYNYAFDSLVAAHSEFEEETKHDNLKSMEQIIKQITKQENFTTCGPGHNIITPYLLFKREKNRGK